MLPQRFGLIGDVHAEDVRLRLTLDVLRAARVDKILCTGDVVDGQGDIDATCMHLRQSGALVIRGNHDRWIRSDELRSLPHAHRMTSLAVDSIDLIKGLPSTLQLDVPGGALLLCHGMGDNDMQGLKPDDYGYAIASNDALMKVLCAPAIRILVAGHTHVPMVRRFERGNGNAALVVINPGTLSRDEGPGFAVLDFARSSVEFFCIGPNFGITRGMRAML